MSNPLASLRELIAPAARRRTGTVTAYANGWATVAWTAGGTGQVLCGIPVASGDTVLVVGESVTARLPSVVSRTVIIK